MQGQKPNKFNVFFKLHLSNMLYNLSDGFQIKFFGGLPNEKTVYTYSNVNARAPVRVSEPLLFSFKGEIINGFPDPAFRIPLFGFSHLRALKEIP